MVNRLRRVLSTSSPRFGSLEELRSAIGKDLGWSSYVLIDEKRVQGFADATNDWQWIHLDKDRAIKESSFGGPVAHGFLSLSLVVPFLQDVVGDVGGATTRINVGVNQVRFKQPVMVGDSLRAKFVLKQLDDCRGGAQATYGIECWTMRPSTKPHLTVESVIRYLRDRRDS